MWQSYSRTAKGRRDSLGYLNFKEYEGAQIKSLRESILDGGYECGPARHFVVNEPKARPITAIPFRDRVVQHSLYSVVSPIFEAGMMPGSYACRKGMGAHAGAVHTQSLIRRLGAQCETLYCLKTDFSKYFFSVLLPALWERITAKISCRHTLWLIERFTPRTGAGLPIGHLMSQLWANVYGTVVDRFLSQTLKVKNWVRYMDDIVIFHSSRNYLHDVRGWLDMYCQNFLGLTFSKWSVQPVSRGVNFLGFRIFENYKLLRHDSVKRAKRKIKRYTLRGDTQALYAFLNSWLGHAGWADSQNLIHYLANHRRDLITEMAA